MTVHLVTFSDESMSRSADLCELSARKNGVTDAWQWHWEELRDAPFFRNNEALFNQHRGLGFWAWKPYIILNAISTGQRDYIVYSDVGVEFINNVSHIIDRMDQDIFLFGNNWPHFAWCKRDVIDAIWPLQSREVGPPSTGWTSFGKQVQASVIFFRVSDYTRAFVKEWLDWCLFEGGRLIDDSPSRLPNHPEFQEHRHDQAILTTMAYRERISIHYWPAVYLPDDRVYEKLDCYADDNYERLFRHHRRRNHEWTEAA